MNKSSFLIAVLLSFSILTTLPSSGRAQQELGSVAIVAAYADTPETFSFVTLNGIAGGTVISFTDNGWFAAGGFRANEGVVSYTTPPAGISAGTVVTVAGETGNFNLSSTGDQIFVFEGTILGDGTLDGNLISGFQNNGTSWDADAVSSNTSALPATLAGASVAMAAELDNYAYTGPTTGTPAELRAGIYNPANWTGDDVLQPPAPTAFVVVQCYMDTDLDGYGDPATPVACGGEAVDNNLDCDDSDPNEFPGQAWYADCDADAYNRDVALVACSVEEANLVPVCNDGLIPDGGWDNSPGVADCDDEDAGEFPGQAWYPDCDADTFSAGAFATACSVEDANLVSICVDGLAPDGGWQNSPGLDCDDEDANEFPGQTWYPDCDADAFAAFIFQSACSLEEADQSSICFDKLAPDGGWRNSAGTDCDDEDATINPFAQEIPADGVDQDCDATELCYVDNDADLWAVNLIDTTVSADMDCDDPGESDGQQSPDCNDGDSDMFPGNPEVCDQKDNDCDIEADEGGVCDVPDLMFGDSFEAVIQAQHLP